MSELIEFVTLEAHRIVNGDRQQAYGHPLDDFSRTAKLWSAILGCDVTAEQVGLCMIALKVSRQVNAERVDNLVDIAGYAETLHTIQKRKKQIEDERSEEPF